MSKSQLTEQKSEYYKIKRGVKSRVHILVTFVSVSPDIGVMRVVILPYLFVLAAFSGNQWKVDPDMKLPRITSVVTWLKTALNVMKI